ncbi:MAG: beta-lactamase family protein, partial [Prolixibacteraceae bacterium]|nr:beta-lactamase family protein [Prolixibacteraceae bacterium]
MKTRIFLFVTLFILGSYLLSAQTGSSPVTFDFLGRMEHYKVPGMSIAVVKDGKIVWTEGFGIANTETGSKVDTNTLFQAGSISKPLAALAALKLVEEGKVNLDEDVNTYLKTWKLPDNKYTSEQKVTLRLLLTHSAGITVHGFPGYRQDEKFPTINEVLDGKGNTDKIRVNKIPGTEWRYSGGGYTIMEKLVEDVSGMPLEEYMAKFILKPMGMNNSTYEQPLPQDLYSQASAAYDQKGELIKGWWHNYPEQAAAGLWTTPTDLAKYCIEIQEILAGKKKGVLKKEMVEDMLTKHLNNWGLGVSLTGDGESLIFQHGGKNAGFTNSFKAY